jgi:hypothetical protein
MHPRVYAGIGLAKDVGTLKMRESCIRSALFQQFDGRSDFQVDMLTQRF